MSKDLHDHMEEHEAEKAQREAEAKRLEEEASEKRRQEWQERDRLARLELNRSRGKHLEAIAAKIQGEDVKVDVDSGRITVDGIDVTWNMNWHQDQSRVSSFRSRPTGTWSIVVGDFGNRTRFPMRKDGTYNYESIANDMTWYARKKIAERKAQANVQRNAATAEKLRTEFAISPYGDTWVKPSAAEGKEVSICVTIKRTLSEDEARQLLVSLRDLGLLK